MTYREEAIRRLKSIGILTDYSAKQIVNLIIEKGDYAPHVFHDFEEDTDDNWDNELKLK
jgi:hypothetical protein